MGLILERKPGQAAHTIFDENMSTAELDELFHHGITVTLTKTTTHDQRQEWISRHQAVSPYSVKNCLMELTTMQLVKNKRIFRYLIRNKFNRANAETAGIAAYFGLDQHQKEELNLLILYLTLASDNSDEWIMECLDLQDVKTLKTYYQSLPD